MELSELLILYSMMYWIIIIFKSMIKKGQLCTA